MKARIIFYTVGAGIITLAALLEFYDLALATMIAMVGLRYFMRGVDDGLKGDTEKKPVEPDWFDKGVAEELAEVSSRKYSPTYYTSADPEYHDGSIPDFQKL